MSTYLVSLNLIQRSMTPEIAYLVSFILLQCYLSTRIRDCMYVTLFFILGDASFITRDCDQQELIDFSTTKIEVACNFMSIPKYFNYNLKITFLFLIKKLVL